MEIAKWHFRVSVKSYFRTGYLTPFGTWVGSRQYATSMFHVTTKLPEAEWVLLIPAWEVWVHINVCVEHLTMRYPVTITRHLSGTPSFDSYVIFSFLSTFTYTLTSHSAALKLKSLCSIWMAPECTCQLTVRAWNTYHESVTIQSTDSSTIPSFSRFY